MWLKPVAYENNPTKTYSAPNAFPSPLRSKRALVQNTVDDGEAAKDRDPIVGFSLGRYGSLFHARSGDARGKGEGGRGVGERGTLDGLCDARINWVEARYSKGIKRARREGGLRVSL